jgi:hypothetical protein
MELFRQCGILELFRQCGIVLFFILLACQIFLNCSDSVFPHYLSLFYIFFRLFYICVYFRIISSSSNFSFNFVVSACDFQFVFAPICFVGFMFYLLFVLFFRYTVVVHDFHIRWYSCRLTVTGRVHSCSKNWYPLRFLLEFVWSIFRFLCSILYIIAAPFALVFSVIVLPVVLQFTASNDLLGIFKLYLW